MEGGHTSCVSSGIVQSMGESKRQLEKRADPWVQITSLIRFTRTPNVQQYDIPIDYLTSTYMKRVSNRGRQKRGSDIGMSKKDS